MDPFIVLIVYLLPYIVVLAFLSVIIRIAWFIFMIVNIAKSFQHALNEQRRLIAEIALSNEAAQAAFVSANQASGQALARMNAAQRGQRINELANLLSQVATSQTGGRWSNGAYFEKGNAIMPGGPSLIDGRLFVPGLRV